MYGNFKSTQRAIKRGHVALMPMPSGTNIMGGVEYSLVPMRKIRGKRKQADKSKSDLCWTRY